MTKMHFVYYLFLKIILNAFEKSNLKGCRSNFKKHNLELQKSHGDVRTADDTVIYLWRAHNATNEELRKS